MSTAVALRQGRWAPEEDAYLMAHCKAMTDKEIGAELGRSWLAVRGRRYGLDKKGHSTKKYRRPSRWTDAEGDRVVELLEMNWSYQRVADAVGRTLNAIDVRTGRYLKVSLSKAGPVRTARAVARLMAVDDHCVCWWIDQEWLKAEYFNLPQRRIWRIEEEDLLAFLANEEYWHLWQPERITDAGFRLWCQEMREGVRFVGTAEAGRMLGYTANGINRLIHVSHIKAKKRGANWLIRVSDLEGFTPPVGIAKGCKFRRFTAEEDAYLLANRDRGWSEIGRKLGRNPTSIMGRYERLEARKNG